MKNLKLPNAHWKVQVPIVYHPATMMNKAADDVRAQKPLLPADQSKPCVCRRVSGRHRHVKNLIVVVARLGLGLPGRVSIRIVVARFSKFYSCCSKLFVLSHHCSVSPC